MTPYLTCIAAVTLLPMCTTQTPATSTSTPTPTLADAPSTTPTSEVHPFTAVGDTVKPDVANSVYYDFGTLSLARTEPIKHSFVLHNGTDAPITIGRIQAACGCTTATTDNGDPGNYKPVLPGKDLTLDVAIDPGHLYAGNIDKMVWVYVPNQSVPAFTMHVTGVMVAAASFSPAVLNFSTVQAGQSSTQKLTVTMDEGAYGANPPDPLSTNPDIDITRDGSAAAPPQQGEVVRTYDISLSTHAHIGALQGTIAMPRPGQPNQPGVGPSVFVTGTVQGDISAAPNAVAFGAVTMGKTATQEIVLTGETPAALKGIKIECGDKTLTGKVKDVNGKTATLEVDYVPAATGSMQSKVSLITKSGEQLDLLTWAWVNPQ